MRTLSYISAIIEPKTDNIISRLYDWLMLLAIVMGIMPLMFREQTLLFSIFDWVSCLIFMLDYVLRWATISIRNKHNRWWAYITYPITPMAIIDLLSILPTFSIIHPSFKIIRISRLLKILRVIKVVRYFESLEIIVAVIRRQRKTLYTVLSFALFYIFITALVMFNSDQMAESQDGHYLFNNFFEAFYWAACTLTTVGYGDIYPVSDVGRIISIISSLVGIAIIALPSGIITAGYLDELRRRE
ncbi:MAG: ion transporter [Prevotella sp.]|nr:ion transporter [Prevotella sp.]